MKNFYEINKERAVNLNQTFKCACQSTFGSHQLYFCICPLCYIDLVFEKKYDCKMISEEWMKFCIQRCYLDEVYFRSSMIFFAFNDVAKYVDTFWYYRGSIFSRKMNNIKSLLFLASREVYYACYRIIEHFVYSAVWYCLCDEYQGCLREDCVLSYGSATLGAD